MNSLIEKSGIKLRKAELSDALLVYKWATDPSVRANSISQDKFSFENHINWYERKIAAGNCRYYILESFCPIGQIRLDIMNDHVLISFLIDEVFRGMGFGKAIVEMGMKEFGKARFHAEVKENNIPSLKVFRGLGYTEKETGASHPDFKLFIYEEN